MFAPNRLEEEKRTVKRHIEHLQSCQTKQSLEEEVKITRTKKQDLQGKLTTITATVKKKEEEHLALEKKFILAQTQLKTKVAEVKVAEDEFEKLKQELQAITAELNRLRNEANILKAEIDDLTSKLVAAENELKILSETLHDAQLEEKDQALNTQVLKDQLKTHQRETKKQEQNLEKLEAKLHETELAKKQSTEKKIEHEINLAEAEHDHQSSIAKENRLDQARQAQNQLISQFQSQIDNLRAQEATLFQQLQACQDYTTTHRCGIFGWGRKTVHHSREGERQVIRARIQRVQEDINRYLKDQRNARNEVNRIGQAIETEKDNQSGAIRRKNTARTWIGHYSQEINEASDQIMAIQSKMVATEKLISQSLVEEQNTRAKINHSVMTEKIKGLRVKELQSQIKKWEELKAALTPKLEEKNAAITKKEAEVETKAHQVKQKESALKKLKEELQGLQNDRDMLQMQLENVSTELEAAKVAKEELSLLHEQAKKEESVAREKNRLYEENVDVARRRLQQLQQNDVDSTILNNKEFTYQLYDDLREEKPIHLDQENGNVRIRRNSNPNYTD